MGLSKKIAIIGAGNMALEHIKAFNALPDVEVVGIHSRTFEKADKLAKDHSIGNVCDSIDELYEKTQADLVVVTVFETAMLEIATKVMDYNWEVMLEKPPGINLKQSKEILRVAKDKGKKCYVGLNRRFLSSSSQCLEAIDAKLDERRYVHVYDQQSLETAKLIGHPEIVCNNWMYANSIHLVDYLRFFCRGEIKKVENIFKWDQNSPDLVMAKVEFESGDIGIYEALWRGPGPWSVSVQLESQRWEMKPLEQASYQEGGSRVVNGVAIDQIDEKYKPGFYLQARNVINAINGEAARAVSMKEAVESMSLVSKIYYKE